MSEMLLTTYNGVILGPIAKLLGWIMSGIYYVMELIGIHNDNSFYNCLLSVSVSADL